MSTLSTFAIRFKELRESAGLKQSEIGEKLGVSRGAISFYENCDRTPDIEFTANAAKFFKVSTDWLLGLSNYSDMSLRGLTANDMGLSEKSAYALQIMEASKGDQRIIRAINVLIEAETHLPPSGECSPLQAIAAYLFWSSAQHGRHYCMGNNGEFVVDEAFSSQGFNGEFYAPALVIDEKTLFSEALFNQVGTSMRSLRAAIKNKEDAENGKPQDND